MNFILRCLREGIIEDNYDDVLHDEVDKWHRGQGLQPLHEYLGMFRYEYALWFEGKASIKDIVDMHKARGQR